MQVYANKKPKVSDVSCWKGIFHQNGVRVYEADNYYDYYKVTAGNDRPKYFFGETAWMQCQSYVVDKIGMAGYNVFSN
jgi:hypothetical protein